MSTHPVTKLALVQASLVVLCYLALGGVLKMKGYPSDQFGMIEWKPETIFLRQHGLWLLLVPIAFTVLYLYAEKKWAATFHESATLFLGVLLALDIFVTFLGAAIDSHRELHYVIIHRPEPVAKRFQTPGETR